MRVMLSGKGIGAKAPDRCACCARPEAERSFRVEGIDFRICRACDAHRYGWEHSSVGEQLAWWAAALAVVAVLVFIRLDRIPEAGSSMGAILVAGGVGSWLHDRRRKRLSEAGAARGCARVDKLPLEARSFQTFIVLDFAARAVGEELARENAALVVDPTPDDVPPSREDDVYLNALDRLRSLKGAKPRRGAVADGLARLRDPALRTRLLREGARLAAESTLAHVATLKTVAAKRRNLEGALEALRADPVPDELQRREAALLEAELARLEP